MSDQRISIIDNDNAVTRRDVLKTCAAGAGLLITVPMLASCVRASDPAPTGPAGTPSAPVWKDAGATDDFKANVPKQVTLGGGIAWITRLDNTNLEAVSAKCTHHGCTLGYDATLSANLVCPCHGGAFKLDGTNVSGTRHSPDKPLPNLTILPVRVAGGQVQINIAGLA